MSGTATLDLNADLGELPGQAGQGIDAALLGVVTSANVACGGHAGDRSSMVRVCAAAVERDVRVGAHPSYVDREHFGRRALDVDPDRLREQVLEQLGAVEDAATSAGTRVSYVKPHGALYHRVAHDPGQAGALVQALTRHGQGLALVGPPGALALSLAAAAGLPTVVEGFADRAYAADGSLLPRDVAGAVVTDPDAALAQALSLAREGAVRAVDGALVPLAVRTLCVHGDTPGAVETARRLRDGLRGAGVELAPFSR